LPESDEELMLNGFYPPVYDQGIPPQDWCLKNTQYLFVEQEILEASKDENAGFQLN
jgi:hypothetical protein